MSVSPHQDWEKKLYGFAAKKPHVRRREPQQAEEEEEDEEEEENLIPPADLDSPPHYIPLRSLKDRYSIVTHLGSGSFGHVSLAKSRNSLMQPSKFSDFKGTLMERSPEYSYENISNKKNRLVAIKTMSKRLKLLNDYTRVKEVRFILDLPYHPNLVQIYELFIDNEKFRLHIAMECMDQNLYQLMKLRKSNRFSEGSLKSILAQILNGTRHIHRLGYFHRDIKPENILVSLSFGFYDPSFYNNTKSRKHPENFVVKLADFGLARHISNRRPYTSYVSTRWYRSPEILLRLGYYSTPVDIWAFGCVATEVALLKPLFPGDDEMDQIWRVLHLLGTPHRINPYDPSTYRPYYGYWEETTRLFPLLKIYSIPDVEAVDISNLIRAPSLSGLCDVVRMCLTWDPEKRASVDEVCQMPYFKGTCVDDYPHSGKQIYQPSTQRQSTCISMEQCGKLAGIGPSKLLTKNAVHHQLRDEHQFYQDTTDFATLGSSLSPYCTDPISSFLKEEPTPYDNGVPFNHSDFGLGNSFQSFQGSLPEQAVPMLTPDLDDVFGNDENYVTTPLDNEPSSEFRRNLNQATASFPYYIDPSLTSGKNGMQNFSFSSQQLGNTDLTRIDLNANYDTPQGSPNYQRGNHHYIEQSPSKNNGPGFNNMCPNEFDGVFRNESTHYTPNYDSQSDSKNAFFNNYEQDSGSFYDHSAMRDADLADAFASESHNAFADALYSNSKFNLRNSTHEQGSSGEEEISDFDENQFANYDQ